MVKALLSQHGVPYTVHLLTDPAVRAEVQRRRALRSGPLTLIGTQEVYGYAPPVLLRALQEAGWLSAAATLPPQNPEDRPTRWTPAAPLAEGLAVCNFLDDSVLFLNTRTGGYLGATVAASRLPLPGRPVVIQHSTPGHAFVVVNHEAGTVTWLDGATAQYRAGSAAASTVATGAFPLDAVCHPVLPWVYVTNSESNDLTVFDARTGAVATQFGERGRIALPGQPGIAVLDARRDRLYVRLRAGAITVLEASTGQPAAGTLDLSTFAVGTGRGLALSPEGDWLFVPESMDAPDALAIFDARTGRRAETLPCAPVPFTIATHPTAPVLYLACFGPNIVELRDARTGAYLHGDVARSSVPVGRGARAMRVDPWTETLFVSCFDEDAVLALDAWTGAFRATLPTGRGPRGLVLLGD